MTVVYISDIETLVKAKMEIDELHIKNEEVEEKSKLEEFVNKWYDIHRNLLKIL